MQKLEFKVEKEQDVVKAIIDKLPSFSRRDIEKLLKNKDVKLNSVRVNENKEVFIGDTVVVYYQDKVSNEWYTEVYVDKNILIVNKRAGIEVVSDSDRDLVSVIRQKYPSAIAVHRIDRNTEGLVIFALNSKAEKELLEAFKTRKGIIKKYALLVHGRVDISKIKRTVYLKKVPNLSKVWISELKTSGYEQAVTEFNIIEYRGNTSLMEAKLITGKTHQIRAHIAYYGHPIVGDNKYGKDKDPCLHLTANYLEFNMGKKSMLAYLNGMNFEVVPTWL